jgi:hypothetical protein
MEARGHQQTRLGIKFAMFKIILNGSSEIYVGGWAGTPRIQRVLAASSQAWRDSVRMLQDDVTRLFGWDTAAVLKPGRTVADGMWWAKPASLASCGNGDELKKAMVVQCENTPANSKDAKSTVQQERRGAEGRGALDRQSGVVVGVDVQSGGCRNAVPGGSPSIPAAHRQLRGA